MRERETSLFFCLALSRATQIERGRERATLRGRGGCPSCDAKYRPKHTHAPAANARNTPPPQNKTIQENGPYTLAKNLTLLDNPSGWDAAPAHLVYVDQPIGTGFSYSDDPRDRVFSERLVADDMLDFFQAFYAARPELSERPTYVTGESYAGHYAPAVAERLWRAAHLGEGDVAVRLAGVAIGNGLTVPGVQFGAYADFALQEGLVSKRVSAE